MAALPVLAAVVQALIALVSWHFPVAALVTLITALAGAALALTLWLRGKVIATSRHAATTHEQLPRSEFDARRGLSYHPKVPNTWYALAFSAEVVAGAEAPLHVRALGQSFAVWRTSAGVLVVQSAICPHAGANVAAGGRVDKDQITCPFHGWRFGADGAVTHVPGADSSAPCRISRGLRTYPSTDWAGIAMVYFHADAAPDAPPEWALPSHVSAQLAAERWAPLTRVDLGPLPLVPLDWVDQSTDYAHFHTLHAQPLVPWTTAPLPRWLQALLRIEIRHALELYLANSEEWGAVLEAGTHVSPASGLPLACAGEQLLFFTDAVVVRMRGQDLESTRSQTLEMYAGPAIMCFHVPFTLANLKLVVCTTPLEGQSSTMRIQAWCDASNPLVRAIGWLVVGVAVSQLASDIEIMSHRVRLRKPLRQTGEGPAGAGRFAAWLEQFYSAGSAAVGTGRFAHDW